MNEDELRLAIKRAFTDLDNRTFSTETIIDTLVDEILNKEKQVEVVDEMPLLVGHLNKTYGLKGYDTAEIGHPVFEYKDRYYVHLLNGPQSQPDVKVTFYKETLKPHINFTNEKD